MYIQLIYIYIYTYLILSDKFETAIWCSRVVQQQRLSPTFIIYNMI